MLENTFGDKSTLVQVMAWCRQAARYYMSQFDPDLRRHMALQGHNERNPPVISGSPHSENNLWSLTIYFVVSIKSVEQTVEFSAIKMP